MSTNKQKEHEAQAPIKNIHQRINDVKAEVSYLQKDEKKIEGKYRAVTHDQVTALLHDALVNAGINIVQTLNTAAVIKTGKKTANGTPIIRYEARYSIFFINVDVPSDQFSVLTEAHAEDTGDKAPGKAMSYAMKSTKLKIFDIETGEDDESRIESAPAKLTAENHQKLRDLCTTLNMDPEQTLEALAVKVYNQKAITDIPDQWFADAEKRINHKAELLAKSKPAENVAKKKTVKKKAAKQEESTSESEQSRAG